MKNVMKANDKYEDPSTVCQLTSKEMLLAVRDPHELARVLCQICDSNGMPVGTAHTEPAMETHVYEVHFPDGCTKEFDANTIAEALCTQYNPDGNQYITLDAVADYKKNDNVAISKNNQVKIVNGKKVVSRSTQGWEFCCEWKDGSTFLEETVKPQGVSPSPGC
ncbi:hypothetical protein ACHAW6_001773 [Cyclotella cf. meneghiniana]